MGKCVLLMHPGLIAFLVFGMSWPVLFIKQMGHEGVGGVGLSKYGPTKKGSCISLVLR